MPQAVGWGMVLGLHSYSDQRQEFEDHPSAELNTQLTRYKGGANDASLTSFPTPLDYKNVAHLILWAEPPCLPICISHKRLFLINLFLAYHFVSC